MNLSCAIAIASCAACLNAPAQERVNPGASLQSDFANRIAGYVRLRNSVKAALPALKPTKSAEAIAQHEHLLAHGLREARAGAAQGDIFTPPIAAEFCRLIRIAMQGPDAPRIRASLQRAAPVNISLAVNREYPPEVPLQSTPPSLLLNLPSLPPELEYRVVGRSLVLRDVDANLIIDFAANAIP